MDRYANVLAVFMLLTMFALMLGSSWNDSAIFDEVAHIGAGYTYLKYRDGRLNPEHPPLLKDLAALPLLFLNLKDNITAQPFWAMENVNDRQWAAGNYLLYEAGPADGGAGNDADKILFWSRLPTMLLAVIFGWVLFWWVRVRYGYKTGLLTLFFFVTSPTFLAHSRFVTTDLGAAFAFFLGIIFFLRFLGKQDLKSAIWLGVILGFALLTKFSLVLLLPTYLIILIFKNWRLIRNLFLAGLIALAVIYAAYIPQVWNYPHDQQKKDARYILASYQYSSLAELDFWLTEQTLTRPLGLYLQGFLMVARRTAGGNAAYFMGEVSSKGWWSYFPTLALTKEQLGFYILALFALFLALKNRASLAESRRAKLDFNSLAAIIFIIFYWVSSILNPLNIGVRHVLPTFPFLYLLVAKEIVAFRKNIFTWLIMLWMVIEIAIAFPYYLSYYNALGGGLKNGYRIATDSNYDWGQDLRRLKIWADQNNVSKIYLDYFGGGSPKYYLGEKYEGQWSSFGQPPPGSYFAVSLNSLTGSQAKPIGDIKIKPEDSYPWLREKEPVARAGSSILIFKF